MDGHQDVGPLDCDLVLEGGGVKGIAIVGAMSVLEERGYRFRRLAGTSAGAVVAALAAAGARTDSIEALLRDVDYRAFHDEALADRIPMTGRGMSLMAERGAYEGRHLQQWLARQLAERGVRSFADLRIAASEDPDAALPPGCRYRLVVLASDVTLGASRRLPWEYHRYGMDADRVPVADAVRASMSIPFFYEPVRLRDETAAREVFLVDGGVLSTFPVGIFDRADGQPPRWPTIGIKLSAREPAARERFHVRGPRSLTAAMIGTLVGAADRAHVDDPAASVRTIFVDTTGVETTDFDLDPSARERLYRNGRAAASRFLERWDFEGYLRTHRGVEAGRVVIDLRERTSGLPRRGAGHDRRP